MLLRTYLATAVAAFLFAGQPADHQGPSMSVSPIPPSTGSPATVSYSDPSKAGQTITVDVDNGSSRNPETDTIVIELDANGEGSATWQVPDWGSASFNAPGVPEISTVILNG